MDGSRSRRPTRESLIDRNTPPDRPVDTASPEQKRSLLQEGRRDRLLFTMSSDNLRDGLGLYPNIRVNQKRSIAQFGGLPWTDDELGKRKEWGFSQSVCNPQVYLEWGDYPFCLDTLEKKMDERFFDDEALYFSGKVVDKLEYFQDLAGYAVRVERNPQEKMTTKEQLALLKCLELIGREFNGFIGGIEHFVMPEAFVRFVNPLGCMGDTPSYRGLTAYFFDLGHRVQQHASAKMDNGVFLDYSQPKKIRQFFEIHNPMNPQEAARLLGNAARHWGVDKIRNEHDENDFMYRMDRFNLYLSCAKLVQCIKERAQGNAHELLGIRKEEASALIDFGEGLYYKHHHLAPTKAEQELMDEILKMNTPNAPEYKEMQRLLRDGDPPSTEKKPRHAIYQYGLDDEKYHAKNFLREHGREGERLLFK